MSGARGLMLFSKGSCLEPAAALTKNSLGGGVMGARDRTGPCGADMHAEIGNEAALVLFWCVCAWAQLKSGQPNKFAARQALDDDTRRPCQPCKDSTRHSSGFIRSSFREFVHERSDIVDKR